MSATKTSTASVGVNAEKVIAKRYALKDEKGNPTETWDQIALRVARHVAEAETDPDKGDLFFQAAYALIRNRRFIPNTPCLVNAGTGSGQLAGCFVLPVEDSIAGIMDHAKVCALVHQSGGGTGMTYERLRPAGAPVSGGRGLASGPVSFMEIVNTMTETVKQGGVRRGANMSILPVEHPDILRFVHAKNDQKSLTNFNISVTVSDEFLLSVEREEWFQTEFPKGTPWAEDVHDPLTGEAYRYLGEKAPLPGMVYAPDVWDRIIRSSHQWAEPGIIFIDNVNRTNPLLNTFGPKRASNPCGEQMLHDNNACNLGSIDLAKYYDSHHDDVDRRLLCDDVQTAVRFLDNVIDVCRWPTPEIEDTVKRTRPVGLGVMGFADLLLLKKIRYGSEECSKYADDLLSFIRRAAWVASLHLGKEKGVLPEFEGNEALFADLVYEDVGLSRSLDLTPRNYEVTTVAPTGTISLAAETSSGIEPNFSYAYHRRDSVGERTYAHPLAARVLGIEVDPADERSVARAAEEIVRRRAELPDYFVDAMSLTPDEHLNVLAACQRHVDNSISKTVNAPASATVEDTDRVHRLAWKLGVKAVSYYRDGSRDGQVLTALTTETKAEKEFAHMNDVLEACPEIKTAVETPRPARMSRPAELAGKTWRVPVDGQKLYVTVNKDDEGRVVEVFANGPISPSVGLLASKMLRGGFTVDEVYRSLNKVRGDHSIWFQGHCCTSPEQVIAACLLESGLEQVGWHGDRPAVAKAASYSSRPIAAVECPECKGPNFFKDSGCDLCHDCGYSKCK
jgi:ribonucleoside-diphosphate reductase alpha chain